MNDAGNNWSSLAPKFAFAHNTIVNYTSGKTQYETVFGTNPQNPMSLKLGLYRKKHKLCCSEFCKELPSHSHIENNMKNRLLENLLKPRLSQALLERERDFRRIYSATFEGCREQTARLHAYRNRFKLRHHLDIGQKVPYETHRQDSSRCQKLHQRRLGHFTVTKRITITIYQMHDDKDPTILKTVHRNHLVEYYPKEESLPPMTKEFVPSDTHRDDFYERFMEQPVQKLKDPKESVTDDSIPFPIVPLSLAPTVLLPKRFSNTSDDSGFNSSPPFSAIIPPQPINHSLRSPTLNPSTSHIITSPIPPSQPLTPI